MVAGQYSCGEHFPAAPREVKQLVNEFQQQIEFLSLSGARRPRIVRRMEAYSLGQKRICSPCDWAKSKSRESESTSLKFDGRLGCLTQLRTIDQLKRLPGSLGLTSDWGWRSRSLQRVSMLGVCLFGFSQVDGVVAASARDQVAPTSGKQWAPANLAGYQDTLQRGSFEALQKGKELVDRRKEYALPDLIDLAQQLNPVTRVAWQNAKQALALVGVSKSAYYPFLSLAAAAGYTRFFVPFPNLEVNQAALKKVLASGGPVQTAVTLTEGNPLHLDVLYQSELTMKWLLFDFGQREATVNAAREGLLIANVAFNATHQRLVLEVSQGFYAYNLARESVKVAESSSQTADTVHSAVEARLSNGLATQPEFLQAEQQLAQARFDLEQARGSERDAFVDLMEAVGLSPDVQIRITEDFTGSVHFDLETPLATFVMRALSQRPDLVASLAKVRAAEDKIKGVKASYFPKINALASVGYGEERTSLGANNTFDSSAPTFGASLAVELPLFDGFLRDRSLQAARAELQAASDQLEQTRDDAVRQVWKSYNDLGTAIRRGAAAAALLKSSQSAYDAVLVSFKQGLSTYTDVVTNESKLTSARNAVFDTQSAIYQAATSLAYAMGELGNAAGTLNKPHRK
jgi:outer membrane protein